MTSSVRLQQARTATDHGGSAASADLTPRRESRSARYFRRDQRAELPAGFEIGLAQ
jgi:hypothetical protein